MPRIWSGNALPITHTSVTPHSLVPQCVLPRLTFGFNPPECNMLAISLFQSDHETIYKALKVKTNCNYQCKKITDCNLDRTQHNLWHSSLNQNWMVAEETIDNKMKLVKLFILRLLCVNTDCCILWLLLLLFCVFSCIMSTVLINCIRTESHLLMKLKTKNDTMRLWTRHQSLYAANEWLNSRYMHVLPGSLVSAI